MRITSPRPRPTNTSLAVTELERFRALGVAVIPGPTGKKGSRETGWSEWSAEEAWDRSGAAIRRGPTNLLVRTGATADPTRFLTVIDLDGKCPCGHDLDDHDDAHQHDHDGDRRPCLAADKGGIPCDCGRYAGVPPDDALPVLRELLPDGVAITQTARGYHLHFFTTCWVPAGLLSAYGAEIYGNGQAVHIPPSIHPSGWRYRWVAAPGPELPVVDLDAVGLRPEPKENGRSSGRRRPPGTSGRGVPAAPAARDDFQHLMATVGVQPGGGADEHHWCPWHPDDETRSLHVDWERAIFHCFGCGVGGGLRELRRRVGETTPPPSCDPSAGALPASTRSRRAAASPQ